MQCLFLLTKKKGIKLLSGKKKGLNLPTKTLKASSEANHNSKKPPGEA
jgi:hypothetical protein